MRVSAAVLRVGVGRARRPKYYTHATNGLSPVAGVVYVVSARWHEPKWKQ